MITEQSNLYYQQENAKRQIQKDIKLFSVEEILAFLA